MKAEIDRLLGEIAEAKRQATAANTRVGRLRGELMVARSQGHPVSEAHSEIAEEIRDRLEVFRSATVRRVLGAVADAFDGTDRAALYKLDEQMS